MSRAATLIVGRGKVGRALAAALTSRGHAVRLVAGRAIPRAAVTSARLLVLALPDAVLAGVAERIAPGLARGVVVLHCAGRLGVEPLAACAHAGAHVGVVHPLASFPSTRSSPPLVGTTFVIAGDARAVKVARELARAVGAHALVAPVHGAAYHAAAAMLAGGAVALASHSTDVLVALGVKPAAARRALAGLLATIAANLAHLEAPDALTGPVARGDAAAVAAHRAALAAQSPSTLAVYDAIAPAVLAVAVRAGLEPARAEAVHLALRRSGPRRKRAGPP